MGKYNTSQTIFDMSKVRIEIHLSKEETKVLDQIASTDSRSRKNLCETEIRKLIHSWQKKSTK